MTGIFFVGHDIVNDFSGRDVRGGEPVSFVVIRCADVDSGTAGCGAILANRTAGHVQCAAFVRIDQCADGDTASHFFRFVLGNQSVSGEVDGGIRERSDSSSTAKVEMIRSQCFSQVGCILLDDTAGHIKGNIGRKINASTVPGKVVLNHTAGHINHTVVGGISRIDGSSAGLVIIQTGVDYDIVFQNRTVLDFQVTLDIEERLSC